MHKLLLTFLVLISELRADPLSPELPVIDSLTNEPEIVAAASEAEPVIVEDLPGLEDVAFNGTGLERANIWPDRYGAYLERVDLRKCNNYNNYLPNFYGGLVVNSRGWRVGIGKEHFTSTALFTTEGTFCSSSKGAEPPKNQLMYHTWEMLYFGTSYQDIRTTNPGTIRVQVWNADPQIYIPLIMADIASGRAYMLHLYPEAQFLNNPGEFSYLDGLLWAKGDVNRLFRFEVDIAGLIKNLDNFSVPDAQKYVKAYGIVQTSASDYQWSTAYKDNRQVYLQTLTQSSATDYICRDSLNQMDVSWSQMKANLQRELQWL